VCSAGFFYASGHVPYGAGRFWLGSPVSCRARGHVIPAADEGERTAIQGERLIHASLFDSMHFIESRNNISKAMH